MAKIMKLLAGVFSLGLVVSWAAVFAQEKPAEAAKAAALDAARQAKAKKMIDDGVKYLISQKEEDGGWSLGKGVHKPAMTAMVLKALLGQPDYNKDNEVVKQGFKCLLAFVQKDGAVYDPKQQAPQPVYTTSIAIMALAASKDPQHKEALDNAVKFLKDAQVKVGDKAPDGKEVGKDDIRVGGVGYDKRGTPNLSTMHFVMEAWEEAGLKPDDPSVQAALQFVLRCQNDSETNKLAFAQEGGNDKGFVYAPTNSMAGKDVADRGLRSYGTMTYIGFKSMLYAGVDKKDPRVLGAYDWIRNYWTLDENPNMPGKQSKEGLFYFYQIYGKALRVFGQDEIPDMKNKEKKHNWRAELIDKLAGIVKQDGSWSNEGANRWEEGNPMLATCYSVMSLQDALK
ncbi:MAG: terpene cyclase/mutase family protein [Planctomycetes bacterium]|nr:terpene cyclase/mutase family protein [Planctomycetota bacterium]